MPETLSASLRAAEQRLAAAGVDNPHLDARLLFCHALGCDRAQLLSQSERILSTDEARKTDALIARRVKREPVARIIGSREFWGQTFALNEATLEPRPDSETLIEAALRIIGPQHTETLKILDLGTGSGCLLLSLLHELSNATGIGIDIAPRAVECATQNATVLKLKDRATFRVGNWFEDLTEKFDIIVSNPPYIRAADVPTLMPEVRSFDPRAALDGGADGLDPYRHLIPQLSRFLNPQGLVVFECGQRQAQEISDLFCANGFADVKTHRDLGSVERCVSAISAA